MYKQFFIAGLLFSSAFIAGFEYNHLRQTEIVKLQKAQLMLEGVEKCAKIAQARQLAAVQCGKCHDEGM